MGGLGDLITLLLSAGALFYGIASIAKKRAAIYFQMILGAVGCHVLAFLYDQCQYIITGNLPDGFSVSYLGNIGCFLFLLTANFGYMDGILDDRTPAMAKSRLLGLLAPLPLLGLLAANLLAPVPWDTKLWYGITWLPACFSAYFHLKHALIPDMGFGFIKAIRPFNIAALVFTILTALHLTCWNLFDWGVLTVTGTLTGISCSVMVVMAGKGVKQWTI